MDWESEVTAVRQKDEREKLGQINSWHDGFPRLTSATKKAGISAGLFY